MILDRANLKRPTMLDVYESLVSAGVLPDEGIYPRDADALKQYLQKRNS